MPNTYAEIPYGTSSAGIALNYGDTVPEGAVNLAYVQTSVPPVSDVVNIEDNLSDADQYAGNTISAKVQTLQIIDGQIIDPATTNLWVAPTDNVLFTTVTQNLTDATGAITSVPLFYAEELRFPIAVSSLPAVLQDALNQAIPTGASTYLNPALASLSNLITITSDSGSLVPTGFLWAVLPTSIVDGELYMTVYTNFASSFRQRFVISWGPYIETLNVHPIYFQHRTTPAATVYLAAPIADNSIGSVLESATIASGSSTAQIVSGGGVGTTNQPRSSPVSNVSNPTIISASSSQPASNAIAQTTANPFYVNGPTGYTVYAAPPVTYSTPDAISAPTTLTTALTLTLTEASCQSDGNGEGLIFVTLYDPTGIPVKSWPGVNAATGFSFQDPNAAAGSYSWTITGSVSDTLGITNAVAEGTYTYTTVWQGSYAWAVPVATTYTNQPGAIANFRTPATTLSPAGSATALSLNITGISTPTNPFGTTNYSVVLTDPAGTAQYTWSNITSTQTLTYPLGGTTAPGALAGAWVWSLVAECANNQTGTTTFTTSLTAIQTWYVSVPGTATLYSNQDGAKVSYVSGLTTLPPTNPNTALKLNLTTITTQADSEGTSAVKVQLVDPTGRIVETWANITAPQQFTYSNLASVQGQWTWNVWTTCTNTGLSASSYTDTWSGSFYWYQPDPTATGSSIESRTIGFTFEVGTPDGTLYATTDDGPQIYLQDPDNLTANDNWYLRLHRGWLSFTDDSASTYLVGLEPYYSQNFNSVIPIITNQSQQAVVINQNVVQVPDTPILVDPNYPIDVVVTRRASGYSFDTWITRDNSLNSGNYVAESLSDINSVKGTITLGSFLLQSNDTVHVTYSYLQYYYTYRGFTDGFGRFVHLDLNPGGGHTWFNLWNIENHPNTLNGTGTSIATVTSYVASVATLINHFATYTTTTTEVDLDFSASANANALIELPFNTTNTAVVSASSTSTPTVITTSFSDESISGITTTAVQTPTPQAVLATNLYSGAALITQSPVSTTTTPAASASATSSSSPAVNQNTVTVLARGSNANAGFTLNATVSDQPVYSTRRYPDGLGDGGMTTVQTLTDFLEHTLALPPVFSTTVEVDAPPVDPSSMIQATFTNLNAITPAGAVEYPVLDSNISGSAGADGADGPTVWLEATLIAPSGTTVATETVTTPGSMTFNLYQPGLTETGVYTLEVSLIAMNGGLTWLDTQTLAGTHSVTGDIQLSALQNSSSTTFSTAPGATTAIVTDPATVAPTSGAVQLALVLSNITLPANASGTPSYNVLLTAPGGNVVLSRSGITTNTTLFYSNASAAAGPYTWTVWATAISTSFGSSSYACSVDLNCGWIDTLVTKSYSYAETPSATVQYFTPVNAMAPIASISQLTATVSNFVNYADSNGSSALQYVIIDPNQVPVASGSVTANSTLTYSASGAVAGQYTWQFWSSVTPAAAPNLGGSYPVTATIGIGSYQLVPITTYVYTPTDGIVAQYQLSSTTIAPTSSGTQLSLTFSSLVVPSDLNGQSWIDITLLNPSGAVVATFNTIVSVPGSPLTYSSASAQAGAYTWQILAKSESLNTGTSSYACSFSGVLGSKSTVTSSTFSPFNPSTSTFATGAATISPTSSSNQLFFDVAELDLPADLFGTTGLSISLMKDAALLQSWTTTAAVTLTYSASAAASGSYQWVVQPYVTPSGTGAGSYPITFVGYYGWRESRTSSYNPSSPAHTTQTVSVTVAPTTAALQLTFDVSTLTIPADNNGTSFFVVGLMDPTSTIVKQWELFDAETIAYFAAGAPTGTWTWYSYPAVTNAWSGAGTYVCTIGGSISHWQSDEIPTTFYTANPGTVTTYQTGSFTVAPINAASALSLEFTNVTVAADNYGQSQLAVTLSDPNGTELQTWTVTSNQTLTYFNSESVLDGIYVWTIQGIGASYNNGTSRYVTQWGLTLSWYEAIENDLETAELVQRALYMYFTVDGYPFHAVLDPLDNPDTPLAYDTNNAMSGTRFALMPTIHAF